MKIKPIHFFVAAFMACSFSLTAQTMQEEKMRQHYQSFDQYIHEDEFEKATTSLDSFKESLKLWVVEDIQGALDAVNKLEKEYAGLFIQKSPDGQLIAINWDDGTGGTMRLFDGIFAYKTGGKWKAEDMIVKDGEDCCMGSLVYEIHQVATKNKKTIYLMFEVFIGSSALTNHIIKTVSIDNGEINSKARFIKTGSGLRNDINYTNDWSDLSNRHSLLDSDAVKAQFDKATATFSFPVILKNGKLTANKLRYRFNGQFFEKIK